MQTIIPERLKVGYDDVIAEGLSQDKAVLLLLLLLLAHQEDLLVEGVHRDLNAAAAVDHAIAVIVVAVAGGGNVEAADVRLMLGYLNIDVQH